MLRKESTLLRGSGFLVLSEVRGAYLVCPSSTLTWSMTLFGCSFFLRFKQLWILLMVTFEIWLRLGSGSYIADCMNLLPIFIFIWVFWDLLYSSPCCILGAFLSSCTCIFSIFDLLPTEVLIWGMKEAI